MHFISALKEYPGDAWIKKYIFPGGVVPGLREIMYIAGIRDFTRLDQKVCADIIIICCCIGIKIFKIIVRK